MTVSGKCQSVSPLRYAEVSSGLEVFLNVAHGGVLRALDLDTCFFVKLFL